MTATKLKPRPAKLASFHKLLDDAIDVVPGPVGTTMAWARWRARVHDLFDEAVRVEVERRMEGVAK